MKTMPTIKVQSSLKARRLRRTAHVALWPGVLVALTTAAMWAGAGQRVVHPLQWYAAAVAVMLLVSGVVLLALAWPAERIYLRTADVDVDGLIPVQLTPDAYRLASRPSRRDDVRPAGLASRAA